MPRAVAISLRLFQNSSSRLTLVLCPAITIERLETEDFTAFSPTMATGLCDDCLRVDVGVAGLSLVRVQTSPRQTTIRQQRRRKAQSRKFRSACRAPSHPNTATAQPA